MAGEQAVAAVGNERHRTVEIDFRCRRAQPHELLGPVMPRVELGAGGRHPDAQVAVTLAQIAHQRVDVVVIELEAQIGPPHAQTFQTERDARRGEVAGRSDPHRFGRHSWTGDVDDLIVDG